MSLRIVDVVLDSLTADPGSPANGQAWYNSTDSKFRFRQGGSTEELGGDFGGDFLSAESTGVSSTTLTTFQTKLSLATGALTGTYVAIAAWDYSTQVKDKLGRWRFQNTTDTVTYGETEDGSFKMDNYYKSASAVGLITLTGTSKTLAIEYESDVGDQANIRNARILFWRVS